ncbi:MAG: methionyl-tRNA formyltransferase [Bacteroidota bacterium]|nr:methionyl-tRNA formyltransferase [Bacteroidota bacterium]
MKKALRIVFMGTPGFAVPSLDILVQHQYDIAAVVTAPDKASGRGQQIHQSAVKNYAQEKGIKVLQPEKLKNEEFIAELKSLKANLFIVVAFRMLPEVVWQLPEFGTFNLHASLLPQYRGAAPINCALINGEKETGATTFFLQHEIDTGNILFQEKIKIDEKDNAGTLHDKLSKLGAQLVLKTVKAIEEDSVKELSQEEIIQHSTFNIQHLKHAPKIFKEDCKIDWSKSAEEIHNLIRGLSPAPAAFTYVDGKVMKIFDAEVCSQITDHGSQQNTITVNSDPLAVNISTDNKTYLKVKCADNFLDILELQMEGKKRMTTAEFLRGYKFH